MKIRVFNSIGQCLQETFCRPEQVKAICSNSLGNIGYVSSDEMTAALIGTHTIKEAAVAFADMRGAPVGIRCMVLRQLNNGDFLYQEKSQEHEGGRGLTPVFTILFNDEQRARSYFQRAAVRHETEHQACYEWQDIPFPGMSIFDYDHKEKARVLH